MTNRMKVFHYDTLLNSDDICNLSRELALIEKGVQKKEKMVVYGRRNSGKTSLIRNVVIPNFKKKHPRSFVMFVDLMEVKDMESLNMRMRASFQTSFRESFPGKAFLSNVTKYLRSLRPVIQVDALTGESSLSIDSSGYDHKVGFVELLEIIQKKVLSDMPGFIVFDEFQDISFVSEAEALFRNSLQSYQDIPVLFMGSKKHLLSQVFAKPRAPFADFGSDIIFQDIPYEEYHRYIEERFVNQNLNISLATATRWQDLLFRNPEAVNQVGSYLLDNFDHCEITEQDVRQAVDQVIELRSARFEEFLSQLTIHQENVLIAISRFGPILEPSSKSFLSKVKPSNATVMKIFRDLLDQSILEKMKHGYQLANPLLHFYILKHR